MPLGANDRASQNERAAMLQYSPQRIQTPQRKHFGTCSSRVWNSGPARHGLGDGQTGVTFRAFWRLFIDIAGLTPADRARSGCPRVNDIIGLADHRVQEPDRECK